MMHLGPHHVWASHPQAAIPDRAALSGIKIDSSCTHSHRWQGSESSPGALEEGTAHASTHRFYLEIHIHQGNAQHLWQGDPHAQGTCRGQTGPHTLSQLTPHDRAAPGRSQGAELLGAITVCLAFLTFSSLLPELMLGWDGANIRLDF